MRIYIRIFTQSIRQVIFFQKFLIKFREEYSRKLWRYLNVLKKASKLFGIFLRNCELIFEMTPSRPPNSV